MKKILTIAIAATAVFGLSGCSAVADAASNQAVADASYEAGKLIGKGTTADTITALGSADINEFCTSLATQTAGLGTVKNFSEEQFVKGCVEGYNSAN